MGSVCISATAFAVGDRGESGGTGGDFKDRGAQEDAAHHSSDASELCCPRTRSRVQRADYPGRRSHSRKEFESSMALARGAERVSGAGPISGEQPAREKSDETKAGPPLGLGWLVDERSIRVRLRFA